MELIIDNLTYQKNDVIILKNISHKFKKGITSIIGETGSGKTTLFELIDYLDKPTSGSITACDITINNKKKINVNKLRINIGFLFQNKENTFFSKTVFDEIKFSLKHFKISGDYLQKAKDLLDLVNLDYSYLSLNPFNLSLGEKTKVALAVILATDPKILLLDEPTIGLDGKNINMLINLLKKIKKDKIIIINSNDISFISKISDEIIVLKKGAIIAKDKKEKILKNEKILIENNIIIPPIIEFINYTKKTKKIFLKPTLNIKKLSKDIIKNVK